MSNSISWTKTISGRNEGIAPSGRQYLYFFSQRDNRWEAWEQSYGEIPWDCFSEEMTKSVCEKWEAMQIAKDAIGDDALAFSEHMMFSDAVSSWDVNVARTVLAALKSTYTISRAQSSADSHRAAFPNEKLEKHFYLAHMWLAQVELLQRHVSRLEALAAGSGTLPNP